jgi:hypothetical protein
MKSGIPCTQLSVPGQANDPAHGVIVYLGVDEHSQKKQLKTGPIWHTTAVISENTHYIYIERERECRIRSIHILH